jgi:hypothetical protein
MPFSMACWVEGTREPHDLPGDQHHRCGANRGTCQWCWAVHSLDSFIRYTGIAPVERSSGKTTKYKQNYGGNRQLNSVLYIVALSHLRWDPKGKAYFEKKVQEGKTKKHAIRCLMSRIACIVYAMLKSGEAYRG